MILSTNKYFHQKLFSPSISAQEADEEDEQREGSGVGEEVVGSVEVRPRLRDQEQKDGAEAPASAQLQAKEHERVEREEVDQAAKEGQMAHRK